MRRDKTPLLLMEQLVTLLVFALAAAVCLRAFVTADGLSRSMADREQAAIHCQNAAETLRNSGGDFAAAAERMDIVYEAYAQEEPAFSAHYNEDWTLSNTRDYAYCLRAEPLESSVDGLGRARVSVTETKHGQTLFELEVAWQEVSGHD